jgi:hypothetical protein
VWGFKYGGKGSGVLARGSGVRAQGTQTNFLDIEFRVLVSGLGDLG